MFQPTKTQIATFLHLIQFTTQLPENYKEQEDGLYKWLASFCRSFDKKSKLTVEEWKELCKMPVIELVELMHKS